MIITNILFNSSMYSEGYHDSWWSLRTLCRLSSLGIRLVTHGNIIYPTNHAGDLRLATMPDMFCGWDAGAEEGKPGTCKAWGGAYGDSAPWCHQDQAMWINSWNQSYPRITVVSLEAWFPRYGDAISHTSSVARKDMEFPPRCSVQFVPLKFSGNMEVYPVLTEPWVWTEHLWPWESEILHPTHMQHSTSQILFKEELSTSKYIVHWLDHGQCLPVHVSSPKDCIPGIDAERESGHHQRVSV